MKSIGLCLSILLVAFILRAEEPLVVPLWTNGAPGFENLRDEPEVIGNGRVQHVNNPSLTIFFPTRDKANGAAVLVCPGGGFSQLSFNSEGIEPARYFTNLGVAAFVLKYRLPREKNSPYSLQVQPRQDGQRAIRLIRSRAEEWNLDTNPPAIPARPTPSTGRMPWPISRWSFIPARWESPREFPPRCRPLLLSSRMTIQATWGPCFLR
jgi:hypothetical protein